MDAMDWLVLGAVRADAQVNERRLRKRAQQRNAVCVHVHSVAGTTCLVDFVRGEDQFTILMSTAAARALQFTAEARP